VAELRTMVRHTRRQGRGIRWVAGQQQVAADQPTIDFVQQQLAPELCRMAHLAPTDDGRVRLAQTGHLLGRRNHLVLKDAPLRLRTHLLDQWHDLPQRRSNARRGPIGAAPQALLDLLGLAQAGAGDVQQLRVQVRAFLFAVAGGRRGRDALRQPLGTARAVPKDVLGPGPQGIPRTPDEATHQTHPIGQQ
jgi:hypothetical protein